MGGELHVVIRQKDYPPCDVRMATDEIDPRMERAFTLFV